ncbi:hypothetical protein Emed_006845 [Eimeria media]
MSKLKVQKLRFADEAVLYEKLKVRPGAVSPFALLHDSKSAAVAPAAAAGGTAAGASAGAAVAAAAASIAAFVYKACAGGGVVAVAVDAGAEGAVAAAAVKAVAAAAVTAVAAAAKATELQKLSDASEASGDKAEGAAAGKEGAAGKGGKGEQQQQHETTLGVTAKKASNFAEWYTQAITRGELIEYYDVSGCYVIRPWAYRMWEIVQKAFDEGIKELGVENCYFPMFVSKVKLTHYHRQHQQQQQHRQHQIQQQQQQHVQQQQQMQQQQQGLESALFGCLDLSCLL